MSRNSRFSKEEKLKAIQEYREGLKGLIQISEAIDGNETMEVVTSTYFSREAKLKLTNWLF